MEIKDAIIETDEPIYSFHAFLYPFKWSLSNPKSLIIEDQNDIEVVKSLFKQSHNQWERSEPWTSPKSLLQWNEVHYFYDYVRPVLYDTDKSDTLLLHYYYKFLSGENSAKYIIKTPGGKEYELVIDDIVISFYNSGVGVLSFHLYNLDQKQSSLKDILYINNYGRRIAPPFLSSNTDLIGKQAFFDDASWESGLNNTKTISGELASFLCIMDGEKTVAYDDFSNYIKNQELNQLPVLIKQLFPASFWNELEMQPVLDDRMFTVCWYGNEQFSNHVKGKNSDEDYQISDLWYQFVNIDRDWPTVQNQKMKQRILQNGTNPRWSKFGTFYGMSRFSFMALTGQCSLDPMNKVIASHTMTIYYKLALLTLVQRASVVRFSEEVAKISALEKGSKSISGRIGSLYKQYIRFINRIYFREVTSQEQGTELYDILQEEMWLEKQVEALEKELSELHQYSMILDEEKRNDRLDLLTYIGAFFVVPSFIGTYFGIGGYDLVTQAHWLHISSMSAAASLLVFATVRSQNPWRYLWMILTAILMLFITFIYPQIAI
jgi:hypothetical protein